MQRTGVWFALGIMLLAAIAFLAGGRPDTARATVRHEPRLTIGFGPGRALPFFHRGAVGLSIETSQLARAVLRPEGPLVELMRALGPGTLRIGGNSADHSWWTESDEPKPAWATSTVTPADLTRLNTLLDTVGWKAIVTVDLGHYEPPRAASEAAWAARALGSNLRTIEIGNEPNAYSTSLERLRPASYGVGNYLGEVNTYRNRILEADPSVRLSGPDLSFAPSSLTWLPTIASVSPSPFAELTYHYYPTAYNRPQGRCRRTGVPGGRALLSPLTRSYEDSLLSRLQAAGALAGLPTRLSETNTTSSCNAGGGPRTSPVFASALWALDWSLRASQAGVSGLNFHGKFGRCSPFSSSPICTPRSPSDAGPRARPEYYGLYAASRLEGGRFVPLRLEGKGVRTADFSAYATAQGDRAMRVAIIDMAPRGSTRITIGAPAFTSGTVEKLIAPSIHARGQVTFGGASVDAGGRLEPHAVPVRHDDDAFTLDIRAGSAEIVTFKLRGARR